MKKNQHVLVEKKNSISKAMGVFQCTYSISETDMFYTPCFTI